MEISEEEQLKRCIARGQPFGEAGSVELTARRTNLETTLRKSPGDGKVPGTEHFVYDPHGYGNEIAI